MSLTKVTYAMIQGEAANILDYGADPTGVEDSTTAIQAALDDSSAIVIPIGNFKITSTLNMNTGNFIFGMGRDSIITSTYDGGAIAGKGVTPSSGTNVRRYSGGGSNFTLIGPTPSASGSIALDMRGCSSFKWTNLTIQQFQNAVSQGDNYSTYYNEYYGVMISDVTIGYYNTALANENLVVGGKIGTCISGTIDSENSHNKYVGLAIEVFTTGHTISGNTAVGITYISSRLEGGTTGISINSQAQSSIIIAPYFQTVTTNVDDNGQHTSRFDEYGIKIRGSSLLSAISKQTINQAIGPISAGTIQQILFNVSSVDGYSVLPGDAVFITVPSTWPNTLIAGQALIGGTNSVYLPVYNISGSPVSLAAANYIITIIKGN